VLLNCRGSAAEAVAYGAGLATWQRRLADEVDTFITPSRFAYARLQQLGAPLGATFVVPNVIRSLADAPPAPPGRHALVAGRLVPEKGVDVAIDACRRVGIPLVIAGDGPERRRLESQAAGRDGVTFAGHVAPAELADLRRGAAVALMPSRSAETFGLAAAEAMAAGIPVAATRVGGVPELVPDEWLAAPGDAESLAEVIQRIRAEPSAGQRALAQAKRLTSPEVIAPALAGAYDHAIARGRTT
jgi:glycosyltransferase involved in cell wall biosynthesis